MGKLFESVLDQLEPLNDDGNTKSTNIDKSLLTWTLTLIATAFDVIVSRWRIKIFILITYFVNEMSEILKFLQIL